jgi:neuronal PAS domain-containing protein 1/3
MFFVFVFTVLNKGQVMSDYYRILNKSGGYSWMQSCATLICNTKNADEQSIICVNYVLSGPQFANIVMDTCQTNDHKLGHDTIKDDCRCDYLEPGEKCEVHGKKPSKIFCVYY